jgi:hypothetical protein
VRISVKHVIPALLGAGAGICANLMVSAWPSKAATLATQAAAPAHSIREPGPANGPSTGSLESLRTQLLEARVAELEAHAAKKDPGAAEPAASSGPEPDPATSEQSRETEHAASIARVRQEPVDRNWAQGTEQLLRGDLEVVARASADRHMSLVGVECKTTSCLATFEWPSFDEAKSGWRGILHSRLSANCAREILLPDAADPSARYQATAVFDCTASRAPSSAE